MNITLVRIDDRLIHGQVATSWSKEAKCERIIVVSDEVDKDTLRKTLVVSVSPPGIKASVVSIDKMVRAYNNPKYAGVNVMLLFTNPTDIVRLVEAGVKINKVNVGTMCFKEGKRQLVNAINIDETDVTAFRKLNDYNIKLELRHAITDPKVDLMTKI